MNNTVKLWITDKNGVELWKTSCGLGYHMGEMRNLQKHLFMIKSHSPTYAKCKVDTDTALIASEGLTYADIDLTDDELCAALKA